MGSISKFESEFISSKGESKDPATLSYVLYVLHALMS